MRGLKFSWFWVLEIFGAPEYYNKQNLRKSKIANLKQFMFCLLVKNL